MKSADPQEFWESAKLLGTACGREPELGLIDAAVASGAKVVAVTGAGGLGKTTIVQEWWRRSKDSFEVLVWLNFENRPAMSSVFSAIRNRLAPVEIVPESDEVEDHLTAIIDLLARRRAVLIFDNLETVMLKGENAGYWDKDFEPLTLLLNAVDGRLASGSDDGRIVVSAEASRDTDIGGEPDR